MATADDPRRASPVAALRAVQREADADFLCSVYASTRTEELAVVPWTDAQKEAFLRMQFDAQDRYWRECNPAATYDVRSGSSTSRCCRSTAAGGWGPC